MTNNKHNDNKDNQNKQKKHVIFDITGKAYSYISMAMIICVFAFILIVTFRYGLGVLSPRFLITEPNPSALDAESGGILTPIIGTFILTIIGIIIAFPLALATAIYLCFYTKKGIFKTLVKSAVDILAGIPTIVIALAALVIFTLPQMGILSVLVDTRVNSLSGTMLIYKYGEESEVLGNFDDSGAVYNFDDFDFDISDDWDVWDDWDNWDEGDEFDMFENLRETELSEIYIVFDDDLNVNITAKQYAETVCDAFNQALMNSGISSEKITAEAEDGKVIIKVSKTAKPLIFYASTNEAVEEALGIIPGETINPGNQREYIINASEMVAGTVRSYGRSFLVCGITMAVMILPFVIKSMEEALKSVPALYIDGALALGATKWRTIYKIVLRAARDGLITGVILGMGRIIGDTAIVWLTLGGSIRMTGNQPWYSVPNWLSTLRNSGSTLTTYIYYTSPAGEGNQFDVAFGASLVLIIIIILLNITAAAIGKAGIKQHG